MMAFDMGGPLNKVAYAFAAAGLGAAATATDAPELKVMAAVMLAGMVPPLALALATVVRPGLFTTPSGRTARPPGLWAPRSSPRARSRSRPPTRSASSRRSWLGSAVTGGLSMAFDVSLRAPHGGIFVLFAVDEVLGFLIALVAGVLVAAALVIVAQVFGESRRRDRHRLMHRTRTITDHKGSTMPSKSVVVGSAVGLHARPAAIIAEKRRGARLRGAHRDPGRRASTPAPSLLIMTLGAGNGDTVEVAGDDQAAVDAIAALVEQDLDA